jgi:outer membrane lipoprotein-sorting protein
MPELRIALTTNDFALASTEMVFVDGSAMRNDFTNAIANPTLDTNVFRWVPPSDYKVTEPLSK